MQQCIFSNKDTLLFVYKRNNSHKLHIQKRIRISLFIEIRSHKSDRFTPVIFCDDQMSDASESLWNIFPDPVNFRVRKEMMGCADRSFPNV